MVYTWEKDMSISSFEIRVCISCGLRYPTPEENSFGVRCPHCLGATEIVLIKKMDAEKILIRGEREEENPYLAVLLDNIRSAWNVGSILRSAEGFGFRHAHLSGITPTPRNEAVTKTSLGAEGFISWSEHKNSVELVQTLKEAGWKIYALEETKNTTDIRKLKTNPREKALIILGSEVTGVDPELLELADEIISIPMQGKKRSFNVSVAFAIAAYAFRYGTHRKVTPESTTKPRTTSRR